MMHGKYQTLVAVFDRNVLFHLPKQLSWEEVRYLCVIRKLLGGFKISNLLVGGLYHLCSDSSMECITHASIKGYCLDPR